MSEELKSCPFCGCSSHIVWEGSKIGHAVQCRRCVALGPRCLTAADAVAWRPMSEAPRDRTDILAKTRPDVSPETHYRSGWNNRSVVIRHEGILDDGFDMGWSVAAPVGCGGMPDEWFLGWQPLPSPPKTEVKE